MFCGAIKNPCECHDSGICGWTNDIHVCIPDGITRCPICPTMSHCVENTCASAGCPTSYVLGQTCQCHENCKLWGSCCDDVGICTNPPTGSPTIAPTSPTITPITSTPTINPTITVVLIAESTVTRTSDRNLVFFIPVFAALTVVCCIFMHCEIKKSWNS
eukprot:UN24591